MATINYEEMRHPTWYMRTKTETKEQNPVG